MRVSLILVLVLSFLIACKSTKETVDVRPPKAKVDRMNFNYNSDKSLTNVVDQAINDNKLVFVDIYADWCMPCKLMDEDVFQDKVFTNYMKANFINYKVDGEKHNGPNIGTLFGIGGYPTLLILDQKGRILERHDGALYQTGLKAMAERAIHKAAL